MSGLLSEIQKKWMQDVLGLSPDMISPKGMELPLDQAGKLMAQTQPGGVFAKPNAVVSPDPDVDTMFDPTNLQANNKGVQLSSIPARARTDADLVPPEINGADVDSAFDNNLSTGDLHEIAGQNPAQAVAEAKLADAVARKAALAGGGAKGPALKAINAEIKTLQDGVRTSKAGLQDVTIKADPLKPISIHDNLEVAKVKTPGAPGGVSDVEVRTHGPNANAPDGSWSQDNATTQINTDDGHYRIPDPNADPNAPDPGIYKKLRDMTDAEKADAHSPAGPQPDRGGATKPAGDPEASPESAGPEPTGTNPAVPPEEPIPTALRSPGSKPVITDVAPSPAVPEPVATNPTGAAAAAADGASSADSGAVSGASGGVASASVLGGVIAGAITVASDVGKVASGQMSVADAAKDAGLKTVETGVLTAGGVAIAKQLVNTTAKAGGVVGGIVGAGLAAIEDVGKVQDGKMTGGEATTDVVTKGGIGAAAGALGAMAGGAVAGSELGAALGTIVPGAGNVVGFVAGAAVGAVVGIAGNALAQTERGQKIETAASHAIDAGLDEAKEIGHSIAHFFGGGDDGAPPQGAPANDGGGAGTADPP